MAPDRFARIESLYHAALSRLPEARAAFLAGACADDATLQREVESLLAQPTSRSLITNAPVVVDSDVLVTKALGRASVDDSAHTTYSRRSMRAGRARSIGRTIGHGGRRLESAPSTLEEHPRRHDECADGGGTARVG